MLLLFTRIAVLAFAVIGQSLLAYALQPEGRGSYAICVLFGVLSSVICTPGTDRGTQYFVMAKQMSLSQGISIAFSICLIGSILATGVALPLIHSDLQFFQNADTASFHLALALIPLVSLSTATHRHLAGLRRFVSLMVVSLIRSGVIVLANITLVWTLKLGVTGAIASLALGHLALTVFGLWDLRRNCGLTFEVPARTEFEWVINYGLKEYIAKVGAAVDYRIGGLLLGFIAGRGDIGLLTAGSALITRVLIIPDSVATYLLPRIVGENAGRPVLAAFCCRVTMWGTGLLLLVWFAVGGLLVPLLLSEAFVPVVRLSWIMSIGVCGAAGAEIFIAFFKGTNRPIVASWAVWCGLAAHAILLLTLYPVIGVEGAAWAMTGGFLCRGVFLAFMFHRTTGLSLSSTLLLRPGDLTYLWSAGRSLWSVWVRAFPRFKEKDSPD